MTSFDRRHFLRLGGLAVLGAAAAACGGGGRSGATGSKTPTGGTLASIFEGRAQNLGVAIPPGEIMSGQDERLPVILHHLQGTEQYKGGTARLWFAESRTAEAQGPFDLTWHDEGLEDKGVYSTTVSVPRDGQWLAVVEAKPEGASETLLGGASFYVGRAPGSKMPVQGDKAISTPTPTTANARGVDPICTRKPACPLHEISLDEAMRKGPVVLNIGTPAFCDTRQCGPELEAIILASRDVPAVSFIHLEVYADDEEAPAKGVLTDAAKAWKLESEPVTYFIDSKGVIADRFTGLAAADEIRAAAKALA